MLGELLDGEVWQAINSTYVGYSQIEVGPYISENWLYPLFACMPQPSKAPKCADNISGELTGYSRQ